MRRGLRWTTSSPRTTPGITPGSRRRPSAGAARTAVSPSNGKRDGLGGKRWKAGRTVEVAEPRQPVSLLRANPRASELPPRERPAIAPVVINNFTVDPERIADLFATARQQPAPVYVQSEQQQEIPR